MPLFSLLLALALSAQLATPALARAPRQRAGTATHIRIGCAVLPHRLPRPIVVIIPSVTVVVISICWNPRDVFRLRGA